MQCMGEGSGDSWDWGAEWGTWSIDVMRCAILDQTPTNGVRMIGQNAVLTS